MDTCGSVDAQTLKQWLTDDSEIALIDVREAGEFASGHLFLASSAPLGDFEKDLSRLVPRPSARVVLMDEGGTGRALRAARLADALGYGAIYCLEGGTKAWQQAGYTLFEGQFVPSKAFGEIAEHAYAVPHVTAEELTSLKEASAPLLILDGRPFAEHRKMNIPGSICLPNGELPYRVKQILPDETVPVVVHCAGRTRSIIGAQILRELGIKNPIFALENGTQGWTLAGFELEHGSTRIVNEGPTARDTDALKATARTYAADWRVPMVSAAEANALALDNARTTYFFDVRTEEEYRRGTVAGAVHAPGGQLIQSTDTWAAVRGARIVLIDDAELRAATVARWLRAMGWDSYVLTGDEAEWDQIHIPVLHPEPHDLTEFTGPPRPGQILLDTRSGMEFRKGHISGAQWCLRANLPAIREALDEQTPVLLCGDPERARGIGADLIQDGIRDVRFLTGTPVDWSERGFEVVATPSSPSDAEAIDYVFFTHDRHSGNLAAARQYLAWETGLVDRLDSAERSIFTIEEKLSAADRK